MAEFELALRTETHELPAEIGNYEEAKAAIQAADRKSTRLNSSHD